MYEKATNLAAWIQSQPNAGEILAELDKPEFQALAPAFLPADVPVIRFLSSLPADRIQPVASLLAKVNEIYPKA